VDRREALAKLAIAGGTTLGAVAIRSSPALAFTGPSLLTEATVTTSVVNNRRVRVTVTSVGTASCPASVVSPPGAGIYVESIARTLVVGPNAVLERAPAPNLPLPQTFTTLSFDVRRRGINSPNPWQNGDSFTVEVFADFTCTYASGSRTARLSSVRTLTFNAAAPGDWIVT
jgi:hypothetical protein